MAQKFDGTSVWQGMLKNKGRMYPRPVKKDDKGVDRLFPMASPIYPTGHKPPQNPKVFVTGTCFSRFIELQLISAGCDVLSRERVLAPDIDVPNDAAVLNKYNLHSIVNEFRWALDKDNPHPGDAAYIKYDDTSYVDLQHGGTTVRGPYETMREYRGLFQSLFAKVVEADIVITALTSVEAWYDKHTNTYLNYRPAAALCRANPDRFELHMLTYNDIKAEVIECQKLLTQYCKPNAQFFYVLTPFPSAVTFSGNDSITETVYGKSIQRAAITDGLIELGAKNAHYLPFYDALSLQEPSLNFISNDYRHICPEMVQRMTGQMMMQLDPDNPQYKKIYKIGTANRLRVFGEHDAAYDLISGGLRLSECDSDHAYEWALCAGTVKYKDHAFEAFQHAFNNDTTGKTRFVISALSSALSRNDIERAHQVVVTYESRGDIDAVFLKRLKDRIGNHHSDSTGNDILSPDNLLKNLKQHAEKDELTLLFKAYRKHTKIAHKSCETMMLIAQCYTQDDRLKQALSAYFIAIDLEPKNYEILSKAMETATITGQKAQLRQLIKRSQELFPEQNETTKKFETALQVL